MNAKPLALLLAGLLVPVMLPGSAEARNIFAQLTDKLPNGCRVMLVPEQIVHIHPVCGDRIEGEWSEAEVTVLKMMNNALTPRRQAGAQFEFVSWGEPLGERTREGREEVFEKCRNDGISYVVFYSSVSKYSGNLYTHQYELDHVDWTLRLCDVSTQSMNTFTGAEGYFNLTHAPMTIRCPTHDQ